MDRFGPFEVVLFSRSDRLEFWLNGSRPMLPNVDRSNLASAMLNSKIRPRSVVGYSVKIFHPSPPNYVTRSPGGSSFGESVKN